MKDFITNTTSEDVSIDDIENICKLTFKKLDVKNPVFSITIVDNKRIREINREYRNKDSETDVISFAFEEADDYIYPDMRFLGEIYISIDKAKSQAEEYGHSLKRELCFLTVHGLLHLLGYDHIEEEDTVVMRALEEEILNEYNIARWKKATKRI